MIRKFLFTAVTLLFALAGWHFSGVTASIALGVVGFLAVLFFLDFTQERHSLRRAFPALARIRTFAACGAVPCRGDRPQVRARVRQDSGRSRTRGSSIRSSTFSRERAKTMTFAGSEGGPGLLLTSLAARLLPQAQELNLNDLRRARDPDPEVVPAPPRGARFRSSPVRQPQRGATSGVS